MAQQQHDQRHHRERHHEAEHGGAERRQRVVLCGEAASLYPVNTYAADSSGRSKRVECRAQGSNGRGKGPLNSLSLRANYQHVATGIEDHMLRHTAEQQVLPPGLAVFAHDDQIGLKRVCFFPDDSGRITEF